MSLLLVLLSLLTAPSLAHRSSVVYLQIASHQRSLTVTLRIASPLLPAPVVESATIRPLRQARNPVDDHRRTLVT